MTKLNTPNGSTLEFTEGLAISLLNGADRRYTLADGEADPRVALPLDAEDRAELQAVAEKPNSFAVENGADKNPNWELAQAQEPAAPEAPGFPEPTGEADTDAEAPGGNASKADWVAYAETQGYDADDLERWSRDDIRDALTV